MTKLTFFGTGTSLGVPIIGCGCRVCTSSDPRDKRLRASALVETGGMKILIDAGPDFRTQMIRSRTGHIDAILLTHNHMDHIGGLDDVRALNYTDRHAIEIYAEERTVESMKQVYAYAFAEHKYPGSPIWHIHRIDENPFVVRPTADSGKLEWVHDRGYFYRAADGSLTETGNIDAPTERPGEAPGGVTVTPIRGMHSKMPVLGFRFGDIAYITDMSSIEDSELEKLKGLKHLTLNTVSYKPHHSHFSFQEALDLAERIGAEHTWLTHLSHNFPPHEEFSAELSLKTGGRVLPAYDGLVIED